MKDQKLHNLVQAALFAALTCLATIVLRVASPIGGYMNLGDVFVLLGAWLLGPAYGCAAAGIGSLLADLLAGYPQYAPGTLVIKALCALTAVLLWHLLKGRLHTGMLVSLLLSGIAGEAIMVMGYFAYEALALGYGAGAAAGIPGNLVQAAVGILLSIPLYLRLHTLEFFQK